MDFKTIIQSLPSDMVCIHNGEGTILYYNEFFSRFFIGESEDSLIGSGFHQVLEMGIVDSPQISYSKKYRDLHLQSPLGEQLHFRMYEIPTEDGVAKVFRERTQLKNLSSQLELLQQSTSSSYEAKSNGAYSKAFLKNELPITYNAYSRTGHRMAMVLIEVEGLQNVIDVTGPEIAQYLYNETAAVIQAVLRRREDFVIEYNEGQLLLCLFNVPLWRPEGTSLSKTVEEIILEIQESVLSIEIPHQSLRVPLEKLLLSVGIVESLEREALDSLLERVEEALMIAKSKEPGHVEIKVPSPLDGAGY